jgi:hypothetical protein
MSRPLVLVTMYGVQGLATKAARQSQRQNTHNTVGTYIMCQVHLCGAPPG